MKHPLKFNNGRIKTLHTLFEGIRFLWVGLWATILDCIALLILTNFFQIDKTISFLLAFYTSVLCRFFFDKYYTFSTDSNLMLDSTLRQLMVYILSCSMTMLIGIIIFESSFHITHSVIISKIISIPCVTLSGFIFFKLFVFRIKK